jgi:hypothetical protein
VVNSVADDKGHLAADTRRRTETGAMMIERGDERERTIAVP